MSRIDLPLQPNGYKVQWSYLPKQFSAQNIEEILDLFRKFVPTGDFTLGKPVREFELLALTHLQRDQPRDLLERREAGQRDGAWHPGHVPARGGDRRAPGQRGRGPHSDPRARS